MPPLTPAEEILNAKIENESLHVKFDTQIVFMRDSHAAKILSVAPDLDKVFNFPDTIRWELKEQNAPLPLVDQLSPAEIEKEVLGRQAYYQWKHDRLTEIVSLIDTEIAFRADGKVDRNPIGTQYFIDSDNGNDGNNGTATGTAWATMDKFTETARLAGDIATCRRGMTARYDDGTDLLFTSDGTVDNPIILEADFDDHFGDEVDLSVTATATLTFGSKTITFASDISGVLAAGDWIYVSGDDNREFAYEVDSVSTTTVTLFLPYKGAQAGSGKTMTNMQSAPIWNTAAGDFQVNLDMDNYWKFQGIHFRGTDPNGVLELDSSIAPILKDCVFEGADNTDFGINFTDDVISAFILKCRCISYGFAILTTPGGFRGEARDCLFDGDGVFNEGAEVRTTVKVAVCPASEVVRPVVGVTVTPTESSSVFVMLTSLGFTPP